MEKFYYNKKSFTIPENYFDELQEQIRFKTQFQKQENFTIPDNYFPELRNKLTQISEKKSAKIIFFAHKRFYISAIAASIALLFGMLFWVNRNPTQQKMASTISHEILYDIYVEDTISVQKEVEQSQSIVEEYYQLAQNSEKNNTSNNLQDTEEISSSETKSHAEEVLYELYFNDNQQSEQLNEDNLF